MTTTALSDYAWRGSSCPEKRRKAVSISEDKVKRLVRFFTRWYWHDGPQEWHLSTTPMGRNRATVWPNGVWHTWNRHGTGGENWEEKTVESAKSEAYYSCIKQGWL